MVAVFEWKTSWACTAEGTRRIATIFNLCNLKHSQVYKYCLLRKTSFKKPKEFATQVTSKNETHTLCGSISVQKFFLDKNWNLLRRRRTRKEKFCVGAFEDLRLLFLVFTTTIWSPFRERKRKLRKFVNFNSILKQLQFHSIKLKDIQMSGHFKNVKGHSKECNPNSKVASPKKQKTEVVQVFR